MPGWRRHLIWCALKIAPNLLQRFEFVRRSHLFQRYRQLHYVSFTKYYKQIPCRHESGLQQAGDEPAFAVIIHCKYYQGKSFFRHAKSRSVYDDQTKEECLSFVRTRGILSITMKLLAKVMQPVGC